MSKKMNMDISANFETVKIKATIPLENVGYDELIPSDLIDLAGKNSYGKNDQEDDYRELAQQIDAVGLLSPLGVIKEGVRYRLFAGERRYNAITKYLHWEKIPCRVFENVSVNKAQLMLHMANGSREYTPGQKLELYEEYHELLQEMKASGEYNGALQKGIAELLNVSDRQVRTYKKLSEGLTPQEKQAVVAGDLSISEALTSTVNHEEKSGLWQMPKPTATPEQLDWEASARVQPPEDSFDWEPIITQVVLGAYDKEELYRQYAFEVVTPQEAIKSILKPQNGSAYRSVTLDDGLIGHADRSRTEMIIGYMGKKKLLKYGEVDAIIRQLIRTRQLITSTEVKRIINQYYKEQL